VFVSASSPHVAIATRLAPAAVPLGLVGQLVFGGLAVAQDSAAGDPPMPSVHRFSIRALVAVDVTGRLVVSDRQRAAEAITDVVTGQGGILLARRPDPLVPDEEVFELLVPNTVYPAFAGNVARLGRWVVERQAAELPDPVRVVVHVSE
jgi:hypothetical protein